MKISTRFIIIFLMFSAHLFSQQMNTDSLLQLLPKAKEDSNKVLLYINIGNSIEYDDTEKAGKYYQLAGKLSKKLNYKKGRIKYISNYSEILNIRGEIDSAFTLNKQAVEIAKDLGDKLIQAKTIANLGNSYVYKNDLESALIEYQKSLKIFEGLKEYYFTARMQDLLQNVYWKLNMPEKGIAYGKAATEYFRKEDKQQELAMALLNLANNYNDAKQEDQSLKSYQESLKISQELDFKRGELTAFLGVGNVYFHRFEIEKAKPYYQKALAISIELEDKEGETIANRGLAMCYLIEKKFDVAEEHINKSLKLAKNMDLQKEIASSMKLKSSILFAKQDVENAEKYLDSADVIQEKLFGEETQSKILVLDKKYETEKKDNEIKLQTAKIKQKNILNYILTGSAAALLLILFLSYRNYNHRKKLQQQRISELETEKKLMATQSLLQGQEEERSRLAKDLHDGLGGLLSGVKLQLGSMKGNLILSEENGRSFDRALLKLDESIDEMRRVAHNMMPESLLKSGLKQAILDYCYSISEKQPFVINCELHGIDEKMSSATEVIVYRIIQELVNNAIKHSAATQILVQILRHENHEIHITVEDNGKGFDPENTNLMKSAGMRNVQSRINYLKGTIDIKSVPGKGTSVFIECKEENYD